MSDEHDKSTELSLQTQGSVMSEEEVKGLNDSLVIDYPMPGEAAHPDGHEHQTLKEIEQGQQPPANPEASPEEGSFTDPKESKSMDCE